MCIRDRKKSSAKHVTWNIFIKFYMNIYIIISVIFAFITPIIGITSIFRWEYKPQRMTRFLVLVLAGVFLVSLFIQDAGVGFYLATVQFIWASIYFGLSFKYWMGWTSSLDISVLIGVILLGIVWYLTNNPLIALVMSMIIYVIAFSPTFIKTWHYPYTESWLFYGCDVAAALISLVALWNIFILNALFPCFVLFLNLTMVMIIVLGRKLNIK